LNRQQFATLLEAKVLLEDWRIDYNINRPHSAHGWLTPVEFVEAWLSRQQLTLAWRVDQLSGPLRWPRCIGFEGDRDRIGCRTRRCGWG